MIIISCPCTISLWSCGHHSLPHTPSSHVLLMSNLKHLTHGISNLVSLITKTKLGLSPGRWESYMTIPECSCGLCRRLLAATVPVQHCTLPEEGYDVASYLVGYGGSGHAYALHCTLWGLFILKFYVGIKWIWGALFLFIWGVLFYSYGDIVYLLYIKLNTCLWKFQWIDILITNLYLVWHVLFFIEIDV
jgi:hypothetical protein